MSGCSAPSSTISGSNSFIVAVLLFGIAFNFRRVTALNREVRWVDDYRRGQPALSASAPKLLASLATMLGERRDRFNLTPLAMRSLLDGLSSRFDESHEIALLFHRADDLPRPARHLLGAVADRGLDRRRDPQSHRVGRRPAGRPSPD